MTASLSEANRMLDAFASIGANRHDVTFLDIDGNKRGFRPGQSARQISNSLPHLMPGLAERQNNLIIRPLSENALVQLDDLDGKALDRLKDAAFLSIATSPGNHQAWVAVEGELDKDFARRLRKGTGADATASGATRIAGSSNYKRKYEPDFPTVAIVEAAPSRTVSPAQLNEMGLVAPETRFQDHVMGRRMNLAREGRTWPDYDQCVLGAPLNHSQTGPDISRADYFFSRLAAQRGWSVDETAAKLMDLSAKAKENGERYAMKTALNASRLLPRAQMR